MKVHLGNYGQDGSGSGCGTFKMVHSCFCKGRLAIMHCLGVKSSSFLGMQARFHGHVRAAQQCYLGESSQMALKDFSRPCLKFSP